MLLLAARKCILVNVDMCATDSSDLNLTATSQVTGFGIWHLGAVLIGIGYDLLLQSVIESHTASTNALNSPYSSSCR